MKRIACLALFLVAALSLRAQPCLQLNCAPSKTVYCGTAWSFDPPSVANNCCTSNNYTVRVLSTVTNSTYCTSLVITQTWDVTACGDLHAQCSQIVTVLNTNQPVFQGVSNLVVYGCSNVTALYNVTATAACCGSLVVTCSPPSGSTFSPGPPTPVYCVATDCCGRSATNAFTVTVVNTNQPVFQGVSTIVVTSCSDTQVFYNPTASEVCCGPLTVQCTPPSGSTFNLGQLTQVNCLVTDCFGQQFTTNFYVLVNGGTYLALTCTNKSVICGTDWNYDVPAIYDPCCPSTNYTIDSVYGEPSTNANGCVQTNSITWVVTDQCGNSNNCTQFVTILDSLVLSPSNEFIWCDSPVPTNPPTIVTGCCTNVTFSLQESFTTNNGCSQTIYQVWQAVDCCSNTLTATNTITLLPVAPTIVCAGNKILGSATCSFPNGLPPFAVLHAFPDTNNDGATPFAGLLVASDQMLYGTTFGGGDTTDGSVFKLNRDGTGYQTLLSFGTGANPRAALIEGADGALYGTTQDDGLGYGTIFTLQKDGTGFSVLYNFDSSTGNDGRSPQGGLVQTSDGALYGTTLNGGANGPFGTVFTVHTNGSGYSTLYSFGNSGTDGTFPRAGLVIGPGGALYGTTANGGNDNNGTIFKLSPNGSNYTQLYSFGSSPNDGAEPLAGLVIGSDGALYGTTSAGGLNNYGMRPGGTVFKLQADGTGYTNLYNFDNSVIDGAAPAAGLLVGCDNALYGTTPMGGSNGLGTLFALAQDGSGYAVLWNFTNSDGDAPMGGLAEGADGTLYGTTSSDGPNGNGTVFQIPPPLAGLFDPPALIGGCCGTNVTITALSTVTSNTPCGQSLTRTWQTIDCCGQSNLCSQTVFFGDTNPPVITCAANKTVPGGAAWSFDPPLAPDASCSNLTVALLSSNLISASPCQELYSGLWQVTDCCSNSLLCTQLVTVLPSPLPSGAAQPIISASPPCGTAANYINLFELCGPGLYWTEGQGVCGGAFCSNSKLGFLAQPGSSPTYSVDDCGVQFSGVASDGVYVYYSSNDNLYRKPVGSLPSDPPQTLATPIGLQVGALALFKGLVFFSAANPGAGPGGIFSMNPDGTGLQQVASLAGTVASQIIRLRGHSYWATATLTADALFLLLADGSLDRCDLSSGGLTLLASSVVDFDLRDELSALGVRATSLYAAEGTTLALSSNTAAGQLWQINAGTGQGSALLTPILTPAVCSDQAAQVTAVAVDPQNIYITLQPVVCDPVSTNGCGLGSPSLWRQANPAQSPFAGTSNTNGAVPYWENAPVPYWELLGVDADAGRNLRSDGSWLYFLADLNPSSNTQGSSVKRLPVSTPALQKPNIVGVTVANTTPAGRLLIQPSVTGLSGFTYQLLRSRDLITWVPVSTIVMPASGKWTFADLGAPADRGFYKANWQTAHQAAADVTNFPSLPGSGAPLYPPCTTGTRGIDPYTTRAPLFQVRMAVEVINTASGSSLDYEYQGPGYPTGPLEHSFGPVNVGQVRVSMVVYDETSHTIITETNTCQIGDEFNGGLLGDPVFFTQEALPGQPNHVYSTNMFDPDHHDLEGSLIQFLKPFEAPPADTLDLIAGLEVLNAGVVWEAGAQDAGVGPFLKELGDFFQAASVIVAIIPGGAAASPFLAGAGAFLSVAGDLAQAEQNGETPVCTVTAGLIPGFGPNDPPTDNPAPLLRAKLPGESLWDQTGNGDAVLAYDLDWRNETQSPGLCERPHTKLYYRISRVVAEGVTGQPPISHGCNVVASEPELLDAFSIDNNGVVIHDQYRNMQWQTGEAIPYQFYHFGLFWNLFPANGHITAISKAPGHVDIFAVDVNGDLDWNWRDKAQNNNQWHDWTTVAGSSFPPGAPIAVVSPSPASLDLFAVDTSGTIVTKGWSQTLGWTIAYFPVSPVGAAIPYDGSNWGGITAVARDNGHLDVFVLGSGNNLFTASWAGGGVTGWSFSLVPIATQGGQPGSQMASLSLTPERMDVFFLDIQGHVQDAIWAGGWSGQSEQVTATAAPTQAWLAAVARKVNLTGCDLIDNSHMDVFTVAADGHILRNSWIILENDNSWIPDQNVELNAIASPTGQIGAVSPWPGSIHVVGTKADGTLKETWFRDLELGQNGGWQETP